MQHKMEIKLERFCYHPTGTLGSIELLGERFYTIEKPWRDNQKNVSCIPVGGYMTEFITSPKFGPSWHIKNVPSRTHILIHPANFGEDVQGCIGLGIDLMGDRIAVANSRKAVDQFEALTKDEEWRLVVVNAPFAGL